MVAVTSSLVLPIVQHTGRRSCDVVLSRELPGIRSSIHWTVLLLSVNFLCGCYFCIGLYLRFDFDIPCELLLHWSALLLFLPNITWALVRQSQRL